MMTFGGSCRRWGHAAGPFPAALHAQHGLYLLVADQGGVTPTQVPQDGGGRRIAVHCVVAAEGVRHGLAALDHHMVGGLALQQQDM